MSSNPRKLSRKARQQKRQTKGNPESKVVIREKPELIKVFRDGHYVDKAEWEREHGIPTATKQPTKSTPKCIECGDDATVVIAAGGKPIGYCIKHAEELVRTPTGYEEFYNAGTHCVLPNHGQGFCQGRYCKECPTHNRYKVELAHPPAPAPVAIEEPKEVTKTNDLLSRAKRL